MSSSLTPVTDRVAYVEAHTNMCLNQVEDLVTRLRKHVSQGTVSADVAVVLFAAAFNEMVPRLLELQEFDAAGGHGSPVWAQRGGKRLVVRASGRAAS